MRKNRSSTGSLRQGMLRHGSSLPSTLVICIALFAMLIPSVPAVHAASTVGDSSRTPLPQAQSTVPFTPTPCPIPPIEGITIDCGYLTVAESRRNFTGKYIQLAVAIMRSPNPNHAPDPMLFLAGGPGQGAIDLAPALAGAYGPTLAQRDIILIDQRGTGYSKPALNCSLGMMTIDGRLPLTNGKEENRPSIINQQVAALTACGATLREAGIDLSAYNSVESAADLEDLRLALGYGPWNIYGGSYGSRLALTAMRYRPETLRSVVLESVYPLQANFHTGVFTSFNEALNGIFAGCAADSACAAAYPDLGGAFDRMVAQMNAEPIQMPITNPQTHELITYIPVSGVDATLIFFQLAYITPAQTLFPMLISTLANGDSAPFASLLSILLTSSDSGGAMALGMQVAVQCNEDATFATARDFVAARDTNRRVSALANSILFNEAYLDVCAAWGLGNPDPAENKAVESSVRTLVINGTTDPITRLEYAEDQVKTLPNSTLIVYPRGGHIPSSTGPTPCLPNIIAGFYNDPAAQPDTSCIAQEAPLPYVVPR